MLWGTDNLKTEGGPIAQALALIGARPRFDSYGRLAGAELMPLAELGRPRIDVVVTLSGIFRDLLPLQTKLLAEAALLAASADEPIEQNFVRKHALAYQAEHGCDLETAALRVFGNADGAYGSNVNHADRQRRAGTTRTSSPRPTPGARASPTAATAGRCAQDDAAAAACWPASSSPTRTSNRSSSASPPSTTTSTRWAASAARCSGAKRRRRPPVYIGDQTRGDGTVRTLAEQVALETRTRMLNPKWYEGMLKHGYEGVRQIEAHVTNTMGWSATTGQVAPWVYQQLTRDLRARRRDARAPGGAEPDRLGQGRQPADRGARAQLLDARRRRRSSACAAPARNSRTGSKASA